MTGVLGRTMRAVLLVAAGGLFWTAGQLEQRVADGDRQLATLDAGAKTAAAADLGSSFGYASSVPFVADRLAEIRWQRVTMAYWLSSDGTVAPERRGDAGPAEKDPRIQFLLANAEFHASQRDAVDRQTMLRKLDGVIKSYTDVLKGSPGHVDAAYNYELVARMRNALAKRTDRGRTREEVEQGASGGKAWKPTMHGKEGEAPPESNMNQFKTLSPLRPDERNQDAGEAGKGGKKVRKG